jgi:EmrB/QacA subfamily drug resistance transporter
MAKEKATHKNLILAIVALAQFMVVLDVSIVNVALPSIYKALNFTSTSNLQWVVTAYTLTFGGFLLLGGRSADLFGRRRMFTLGVGLFVIASLLTALAQSSVMIEITRALQGTAAAIMSPAALSIVLATFKEGHERNKALSIWGGIAAGGAAAGVLIGGILTQYLNWRWNFFINVPVGIAVIAAAFYYVDNYHSTHKHKHLDLSGALFVTAGVMTLVYGLTQAPSKGWTNSTILTVFGVSIALLIAFVINEQRKEHPLIPLDIFKVGNIAAANLTQFPITACLYSMFFFLTLYLQEVLHFSPVKSGLSFLPITFVIGFTASRMSKVIGKFGYKKPLMIAPVFLALGLYYLSRIQVDGNYWKSVFPGILVIALGLGIIFVSITVAATSGVPKEKSGLASGLLNTSQQIGGAIGLAILSGVSANAIKAYVINHPGTLPNSPYAQVHSYHDAFLVGVSFAIIAFLLSSFLIKQRKEPKTDFDIAPSAGH